MTALGVDRATGRWVWILLSGADITGGVVDHLSSLPHADVIGIDIPLRFPSDGRRQAEVEARALLPGRASTVFTTFPRWVYDGRVYDDALRAECRERLGSVPSAQAHALGDSILEAVDLADDRWIEVHPELAFRRRLGAPAPPKRRWHGVRARLEALSDLGIEPPDVDAATDDVLDAAICAAVARDRQDGRAMAVGVPDDLIWW